MVESVLNMFERIVNSDSTIDIFDNSFQCYFKVLSKDHVNYPKHRQKAIPHRNFKKKAATINVARPTGRAFRYFTLLLCRPVLPTTLFGD